MGALPLDEPESRDRVATWRQQPGMLGLRYGFLHDPARRWLHDGDARLAVGGGRESRRPDRGAGHGLAGAISAGIAERHPGLRLTIDHLGGRGGT